MTDDPVARLKAGLGADEAGARELLAHSAAARDRGLASTLWDEQDQAARRMLREVAAKREILAKYEALEAGCRTVHYGGAAIVARDTWKQAVRALATAYGDNDEVNRG